jgi:uncharacterized membrane protein YbaN (DUF454 family)
MVAVHVLPDQRPTTDGPAPGNRIVRTGWLALGLFCVLLGIIGAILPLMPTTIFLILAAGCFARSSPRLETWLLNHAHFGSTLRAWRANGAISRKGKIAACSGITLGYILFTVGAHPRLWLALTVAAFMLACAAYVVSRPTATN